MRLIIDVEDTDENRESIKSFFEDMNNQYTTIDVDALHSSGWDEGMTGMSLCNARITLDKK